MGRTQGAQGLEGVRGYQRLDHRHELLVVGLSTKRPPLALDCLRRPRRERRRSGKRRPDVALIRRAERRAKLVQRWLRSTVGGERHAPEAKAVQLGDDVSAGIRQPEVRNDASARAAPDRDFAIADRAAIPQELEPRESLRQIGDGALLFGLAGEDAQQALQARVEQDGVEMIGVVSVRTQGVRALYAGDDTILVERPDLGHALEHRPVAKTEVSGHPVVLLGRDRRRLVIRLQRQGCRRIRR